MIKRPLGNTGLHGSPIAIGGAAFTYVHETSGWNPRTEEGAAIVVKTLNTEAGVGVVSMRTMTSGIFQREASFLAPEWQAVHDLYDAALKFVLSDSRVHAGIVGMRWPHEVAANIGLIDGWDSPTDIADMPRVTFGVYEAEDRQGT